MIELQPFSRMDHAQRHTLRGFAASTLWAMSLAERTGRGGRRVGAAERQAETRRGWRYGTDVLVLKTEEVVLPLDEALEAALWRQDGDR